MKKKRGYGPMTTLDLNPRRYVLTKFQADNLNELAMKCSVLEELYGRPFEVTSGIRIPQEQQRINPKNPNSPHLDGRAVDVKDQYGDVWRFLMANMEAVEDLGFYLEAKAYTPRHCHLQISAPKSGNRVFIPA